MSTLVRQCEVLHCQSLLERVDTLRVGKNLELALDDTVLQDKTAFVTLLAYTLNRLKIRAVASVVLRMSSAFKIGAASEQKYSRG